MLPLFPYLKDEKCPSASRVPVFTSSLQICIFSPAMIKFVSFSFKFKKVSDVGITSKIPSMCKFFLFNNVIFS